MDWSLTPRFGSGLPQNFQKYGFLVKFPHVQYLPNAGPARVTPPFPFMENACAVVEADHRK
jgi:hypothetical protein